jgi:hypothetical protein
MPDLDSIHIQIGRDLSGIVNFGSIGGNLVNTTQASSEPEPPAQATEQGQRPLVFLCHASEDKPAVRPYRDLLRAAGLDTWLDEDDILAGQSWDQAIREAIRRSRAVLIFISRHSTKTSYLQEEIKAVLDEASRQPQGTIFMIPALLEACPMPVQLSAYQWVELYQSNGYEKLLQALQTLKPEKH